MKVNIYVSNTMLKKVVYALKLILPLGVLFALDRKKALLATKTATINVGTIFALIGFAMISARVFTREGVIQLFVNTITSISDNRFVVLMIVNIIMLILGMFVDDIPILVIAVPLLIPLAENVGVNLVHLGAIMAFNIGIGQITPPYALAIFLGSSLSGVSYTELTKVILFYLLIVSITSFISYYIYPCFIMLVANFNYGFGNSWLLVRF